MGEIIYLVTDEKTVLSPAAPGAYKPFWFPGACLVSACMCSDKGDGAEEWFLLHHQFGTGRSTLSKAASP